MFPEDIRRRLTSDVTQHDSTKWRDFVSLLRIFWKQTMHVMLYMDDLYTRNELPAQYARFPCSKTPQTLK